MRDLRANLWEQAAACRSASRNALSLQERQLLDILAELWFAIADDWEILSEQALAEEIIEVSTIHTDVMAALRPTLH